MANGQVLYKEKYGPTTGIDRLFGDLEKRAAEERGYAHATDLLGLKHAYGMEEAEKQHTLAKDLASWQDNLLEQRRNRLLEEQSGTIKFLQGAAGEMAQGGTPMPEFVQGVAPQSPEEGIRYQPRALPKGIDPTLLNTIFSSRVSGAITNANQMALQEAQDEREALKYKLGLAPTNILSAAQELANEMDTYGDEFKPMAAALRASAQEGAKLSDVTTAMRTYGAEMAKQRGLMTRSKELEKARLDRGVLIQKMKGESAIAVAKIRTDPTLQNINIANKHSLLIKRQIDAVEGDLRDISMNLASGTVSGPARQNLLRQQLELHGQLTNLQEEHRQLLDSVRHAEGRVQPNEDERGNLRVIKALFNEMFPKLVLPPTINYQEFDDALAEFKRSGKMSQKDWDRFSKELPRRLPRR